MTTADATGIGQTGATLSASYTGASETPEEVGFQWGTSKSHLNNELYVDMGSGTSGSFSKQLSSLSQGTTYYYRAYIRIGTDKYYYGAVKSFTTLEPAWTPNGDVEAYNASWLGHLEVPATDVNLSKGQSYNDRKGEKYGGTYAYIFNPSNSSQLVVTHTFSYNNKEVCNYTMLYDANKHCALWAAFEMDSIDHPNNNVGRDDVWDYDPAIPNSWQPFLDGSYSDSSYDRGHQVASSDRQTTDNQNKETFYYSNMTPQFHSLNGGQWLALENDVQGLQPTSSNVKVYVVTGPVFDSNPSTTDDKNGMACPVPSQYYKCVMRCTFDDSGNMTAAEGIGFVFSNASNNAPSIKSIDTVEEMTGFDFFANVPASFQQSAERAQTSFF